MEIYKKSYLEDFKLNMLRLKNCFLEKFFSIEHIKMIEKASEKGVVTGFEPYRLKKYSLRAHSLMSGSPGKGLGTSGFSQKNKALGQEGEENFAKTLEKEGMLDKFLSFWSIHNLSSDDSKIDADIDCILVSSKTIWLIDLKFYASGNVVYKTKNNQLYTLDCLTGYRIGNSKKMSANMMLAEKNFRTKFSGIIKDFNIRSCVVFMPTNNGSGKLQNVYWPGDIKAYSLLDILEELKKEPAFEDTIGGQKIKYTFQVLVKRR